MSINRRGFMALSGSLAAGTAAGFGWPRDARAAEALIGVTYLTPSYKALTFGSDGFVDYLRKHHADTVDMEFYDSGSVLTADLQLPSLRTGAIDLMFHTISYITRSLPVLGITGLPGVVDDLYRHPERLVMGSPLFELINRELADDDLYMLSCGGGLLEPEFIWSTAAAPIRTLDDIGGKRVRVVSFEATKAIEDLGGAATNVSSSELYLALQRGTVDAAVANISTIIGRSIEEQAAQVYRLPVTAFGIGIFVARSRWQSMSREVKDAMLAAARWFDENSAATANNEIYRNEYWPKIEQAGIEIIAPDAAALRRFTEVSRDARAAWVQEVGAEVGERAIALATGRTS